MAERKSSQGGRVFVAMQKHQYQDDNGTGYFKWERTAVLRPGFAYVYVAHDNTQLFVEEVSGATFMRALYVDEDDYKEWSQRKDNIRHKLSQQGAWLLEVVRSTRDSMVCNVLTTWAEWDWREPHPEVLIGESAWIYRIDYVPDDKRRGRRAYVTLDGNTHWEIEEIWPATAPNEPVRLVLVRRTSFPVLGIDSVLAKDGLDFLADESKRKEHESTIRRIEGAVVDGDSHSIRECSQVAEALLFQLGKQHLKTGKPFGQFEDVPSLQQAHLEPLLRAFVATFGDIKLIKDEMKWIPGAILAIRGWGEDSRHEGKDDRQLLEADGMTGVFTYAALRDFVRLCQHVHKRDPKVLNPPPDQAGPDKSSKSEPQ